MSARTPVPKIRQLELVELQRLKARIEEAEEKLALLHAELATNEAELLERLQAHAKIERGELTARVGDQVTPAKCSPPWKPIYLSHMQSIHGIPRDVAENAERALHPAGPDKVTPKLIIENCA